MMQLEETLVAVAEAVVVPEVDRLRLAREGARLRRRGRVVRATGLAAGVALIAGTLAVGVSKFGADPAPSTPGAEDGDPAESTSVAALRVGGELVVRRVDGSLDRSGIGTDELLASTADRVWYVTDQSEVSTVAIRPDGTLGEPSRLSAGPVDQAAGATAGTSIAWVDLQQRLFVLDLASNHVARQPWGEDGDRLLDVDVDRWVVLRADREVLVATADSSVSARATFPVTDAQLAGDVLLVTGLDGSEQFDSGTGQQVSGFLGGRVAALSPTGAELLTGYDLPALPEGSAGRLTLLDTTQGTDPGGATSVSGFTEPVAQIQWRSADSFFVATMRGAVLECTTAAGQKCRTLFTPPDEEFASRVLPTS